MIKQGFLFLVFLSSLSGVNAQKDTYDQLKTQYDSLRKAENYEGALLAAKQMNTWALQNETDTSLRYAVSLSYFGNAHEKLGNRDSTFFYLNKSVELFEEYHAMHPDYAMSLNNLGILYKTMGDYKAAEPFYKQALEIYKKTLGEEHPDYAISLNSMGALYSKMDEYLLAENYYKQAIEILTNESSEEKGLLAMVINNLGDLYLKMGAYESAEKCFEHALEYKLKNRNGGRASIAVSYNSLGNLNKIIGEYKKAESYYDSTLEIRLDVLGKRHPEFAMSLKNLGELYLEIGKYDAAENLFKQALEIYKNAFVDLHPDYATILNSLGILYKSIGNFDEAENNYLKALEIRKETIGERHTDYASNLNSLGALYSIMGNYLSAEKYYKQALEIKSSILGEDHLSYAMTLNNLGDLYSKMYKYDAAEDYYVKALEIKKNIPKEVNLSIAVSYISLGNLNKICKHFSEAEKFYIDALEIYRNSSEESRDYAINLSNLGELYKTMGDYKAAEPYYEHSLEILKKTSGEEHPSYIAVEVSYTQLLALTSREGQAYEILNKNLNKKNQQIIDNFEWLNDNQKEAYWKKESSFYDNLSWFANETFEKVPEAVGLNYNAALVTKSKMLEAKISSENYYREVDELREELAYRKRLLAKMESDGSTEKEKLEKLSKEADSLDKRLTLSWPEYAQQKKNLSISWDQVQQNLDRGEAAIEFVRFKNEDDSTVCYNALVLKKGDKNPTLIKLCKETDLQAIMPKMGYSAYYPLVWQPLEAALKDVKTIYYAPTGELYNVPFHAIYAPNGKGDEVLAAKTDKRGVKVQSESISTEQDATYLLDRYTLHQLTSTRYLAMGLKQKEKEPVKNNMAMAGGINYDYLPGSTAEPKKSKKDKKASRSSASASERLNYLDGTKTEVEQIYQQLTTANWKTKLIENNDATEENITKLEGKEAKGILHLATHGYAFSEYDFSDTTIGQNSLRYSYRYSINPMVRSGLILAGGNWAWTGSDTLSKLGAEQNGILTALEVSQLNLKKTKLVVLSACETGLGKIEGSEGTFGLKRGFKLAGVEQIIVSLWSVPDKETMELMTLFYTDLARTLNPVVSFEKAQKEMRLKYPTEPEKWAGFVLVR